MAFSVKTNSLTALEPVGLNYGRNSITEALAGETKAFDNGLTVLKHSVLSSCRDAALSNDTCLLLTDVFPIAKAFEPQTSPTNLFGNPLFNNGFFLKRRTGEYLKIYKDNFYFGGIGNDAFINMIVFENNFVELTINNTKFLQVSQTYPYDVFASEDELDSELVYTKRFQIEYYKGLMYFKCRTPEGTRFLSCGVDRKLRAVGCMLNSTSINPYLLIPQFFSETQLRAKNNGIYDHLKTFEVKYINEITGRNEHENLTIGSKEENDTNLLITFATEEAIKAEKATANVALLKNNFTASGNYSTK